MNKAILIGRLCADVDLRHTQNGTAVATYRLAVNRDFKREGKPEADYLSCVTWGNTAEWAAKYLRKGMRIAVVGRIETRSYDDPKDGKKVYVTEIVVDRHEFCESKNNDGSRPAPQTYDAGPYTSAAPFIEPEDDDNPLFGPDDFEPIKMADADLPF